MSEPQTTTSIIEDTLNRPIIIPEGLDSKINQKISEDIKAFILLKRKDLDPILMFTKKIESLIPRILMNILVQKSKKDENQSHLTADTLMKIKEKQDEHFASQLNVKKLLIEMLFEILESHHKDYLDSVDHELIREIYNQVHLWNINTEESLDFIYFRIANSSKIVPAFITSAVAQATLTPYICAMVARKLSYKEVASLAKSFKPGFLAEASLHLEAETIAQITDYLPLQLLKQATNHLINEEHLVHMGEITDYLSIDIANAIVNEIHDADVIAQIISFMQNHEKIKNISTLFNNKLRQDIYKNLRETDKEKAGFFSDKQMPA